MGGVIDEGWFEKMRDYMEVGKEEGGLVSGGTSDDWEGYLIEGSIFGDVEARCGLMEEEMFGGVVSGIR
ncbi:aldehyde dehydrogenase family protein [Bacillus pumilus]|uniref:aldehyde dehydrogenase family protein n=1 Tax=Bacillus pumilus TaxID=1408 RepID=UPI0021B4CE26|nr:aldehyde dehydrogenase family protein [Bacillus pumilus]